MATKVCPVPLDEVVRCHAGCVAFFVRSRGPEFAIDACKAVMRLMLSEELTRKERAVARALIWLDTRVLRPSAKAHEAIASDGRRSMLVKYCGTWLLVDAEPANAEHAAVLKRLGEARLRVHLKAREIQSKAMSLRDEVEELYRLSKLEAELNDKSLQRVRVACVQSQRAEDVVNAACGQELQIKSDHLDARLVESVPGAAGLVDLALMFVRGFLDARDPKLHYELGLLDLLEPVTLDEWRAARHFLESEFAASGFDDGELTQLLPDAKDQKVGRKRAAQRRQRAAQRQRPAIDFTNGLPAMFGLVGGDRVEQSGRPQ